MTRSKWHYTEPMQNVIAIYDDYDEASPTMSVTNDVEQVIDEMHKKHHVSFLGKRVIYRDTEGRWDELVVYNNTFRSFKGLGADSLESAIDKIMQHAQ